MTGWQALMGIMCPSWLAQHLNKLYSKDPPFSVEYIEDLDYHCPYESSTGHALCTKCWMDFLRGDVK